MKIFLIPGFTYYLYTSVANSRFMWVITMVLMLHVTHSDVETVIERTKGGADGYLKDNIVMHFYFHLFVADIFRKERVWFQLMSILF